MPYKDFAEQQLKQSEYNATHRIEIAKYKASVYIAHRIEIRNKQAAYNAAHRAEKAWNSMHRRAGNKDGINPTYTNVHICRRWSGPKGKENFVKDMGQPPKGTSLSRFGDVGDYKKSNCAWHTWKQQWIERKKRSCSTQRPTK
jgi:hypothetical protein